MTQRVLLPAIAAVLVLATGLTGAGAEEVSTVAVRLTPGALEARGIDASFLERYGSFDWAVIESGDVPALRGAGVAVEVHPEAGTLVLPSARFDPLLDPPAAVALRTDGPSLHLVQFHGPIKDAWLDALRSRGARLVQYVAPFSYVVLLDTADRPAVAGLRPVRWVGAFDPAHRFGDLDLAGAALANALVIDDGGVAATVRALESAGVPVRVTTREMPFHDVSAVGIQVPASALALEALVGLPNVYSISPQLRGQPRDEMSDQIVAGNYSTGGVPADGYSAWLTARGVTGAGVTVAHVDDGYSAAHPDSALTVAGCKDYAVPTGVCPGPAGVHSTFHGQHTGGIIVGTGTVPAEDASGFRYGLGVAPGAKLYVQNYIALGALFGPSGSGQYLQLNRDSVLGGATVSANSWGPAGTPRGYDADTREFDFAPRDANLDTPQHEPLAFVLSIMNGNGSGPGGAPTQGTPDEGKNLLRVGSTKNYRAGNIGDLSTTSAHGPALDGRRLPDVVAPGQTVASTANPATIGLCGGLLVGPWVGLYATCTGTSMASPHVSGASALFTEWWRKSHAGQTPSPALQKAAFINGAVDLFGKRDADNGVLGHIPDSKQGWGRINLENVFAGAQKSYLDQTVLLGQTGASHRLTVEPVDPAQPVKITLVWTDAPGPGLGGSTPAWVNDLDLRVTSGSGETAVTYRGNVFGSPSTGWSVPGGAADFKNNVENVYLQQAPAGPVTVDVVAANLAGDGVPGNGDDTDQDFALVVSNGRLI